MFSSREGLEAADDSFHGERASTRVDVLKCTILTGVVVRSRQLPHFGTGGRGRFGGGYGLGGKTVVGR